MTTCPLFSNLRPINNYHSLFEDSPVILTTGKPMDRSICLIYRAILVSLFLTSFTFSQKQMRFQDQRALEDYSHLRDSTNLDGVNTFKFIALDKQSVSFVSFGGSVRPRYEVITNEEWTADNNQSFYSQRIAFHTDVYVGKFLRFFGELQHGYKTGEEAFLDSDQIDIHQSFIELRKMDTKLSLRFGRQELKYGAGRLIDYGFGPNIRRSFDIGKITYSSNHTQIEAYYGKDVRLSFKAFDNGFNLFKGNAANSKVWGIYGQFSLFPNEGETDNTELYYLGIESPRAGFNDVLGKEVRHSIGIRRYGVAGTGFTYNTELIYQFGKIDNSSISAFNFETDWQYSLSGKTWRPTLGLKFDLSSGDENWGDEEINSFNPMYVNPAIYSLAIVNTPVNLVSIHPSITIFPKGKFMVELEFAVFGRTTAEDGLYSPPNRQVRMANDLSERHIGNTIGLFMLYNYNRYLNFNIRSSYFMAGDFVKASGTSEPIFQFAPTITIRF